MKTDLLNYHKEYVLHADVYVLIIHILLAAVKSYIQGK